MLRYQCLTRSRCACTCSASISNGSHEASNSRIDRDRLLLLDAHALVYRSYFGFKSMNLTSRGRQNEQGTPKYIDLNVKGPVSVQGDNVETGSLYGFFRTLLTLLEIKPKAKYVAIVFDPHGKNWRHQIYPEYKENRVKTPNIREKILPLIVETVEAMQLKVLEIPGYEADDVIATVCKKALSTEFAPNHEPLAVDIASPDKDFFQLLSPPVRLLRPAKKKFNNIAYEPYTERTFTEEFFGLEPETFADFLSLTGDATDNVPGVRRIGPKTAAKLLNEYKTLDCILEHANEIKGKVTHTALTNPVEVANARTSRRLVEFKYDIEESLLFESWDDLLFKRPTDGGERLLELFDFFDFQSLSPRVQNLWKQIDENVCENI